MRYDHQTCGQQAQSDESFFAAGEAVVLESDAGAGKNLIRVLEAEPVLGEVCPVFSFIHWYFISAHYKCNSFCSYVQVPPISQLRQNPGSGWTSPSPDSLGGCLYMAFSRHPTPVLCL